MTESSDGLRILARMIARAYLADERAKDAGVPGPRRKAKKDENIPRAKRDRPDGKSSHQC